MLSIYPAIFFRESDGSYSVVFPDLNHLSTCGETMQETMEMAVDALAGYLYTERLDGHDIPVPTPLDQVDIHCEDDPEDDYAEEDRFVNLVAVDVEDYARAHFQRSVKKTLSIPKWMNDMATARKINFSKLLQTALRQELGVAVEGS